MIELEEFKPYIYAFTYDDYAFPLEEWVKWHTMLGYPIYLLFVGKDRERMKEIEEKYGINVWYVDSKRNLRFIDHRAYYKYLAQLTTPPGLKIMLDLDEFIPYKIPAYPRLRPGHAGGIKPYIVYKGEVYDDDKEKEIEYTSKLKVYAEEKGYNIPELLSIGRGVMLRIHKEYAQVLGDGGSVGLELDERVPPIPVLHLEFKNCHDMTLKTWLWVAKGKDYCGKFEELPLKKIDFTYDSRLRDIIKDLPKD